MNPRYYHTQHAPAQPAQTLYFKPVPGQVVFATALVLIVLVAVGWYLIAQKCKCRGGD